MLLSQSRLHDMECRAGVGRDPAGIGPGYRSGCGRVARPLIHDLYAAFVLAKINGCVATAVQSVGITVRAVECCDNRSRPQLRVALHRHATLPGTGQANARVAGLNQRNALTGADRSSNVLGVVGSDEASSRLRLRHSFGGGGVWVRREPRAKARTATLPTLDADVLRHCRSQGRGERSGYPGGSSERCGGGRHQTHLGTRRLQYAVKVLDQNCPSKAVAWEITGWPYNLGCGCVGAGPSRSPCRCSVPPWHSHLPAPRKSSSENQHHQRPQSLSPIQSAPCAPPIESTTPYRKSAQFAVKRRRSQVANRVVFATMRPAPPLGRSWGLAISPLMHQASVRPTLRWL